MSQDRWFEDYVPGTVHDLGSVVVDEQEVIAFARQFDPQPFHLDKERAEKSAFFSFTSPYRGLRSGTYQAVF